MTNLNHEKLGTYKPSQCQPSEEDFKHGFKEKIRFFKYFFSDNCLILQLSIATQLSINLLFAWIQFSFFDAQNEHDVSSDINQWNQ